MPRPGKLIGKFFDGLQGIVGKLILLVGQDAGGKIWVAPTHQPQVSVDYSLRIGGRTRSHSSRKAIIRTKPHQGNGCGEELGVGGGNEEVVLVLG